MFRNGNAPRLADIRLRNNRDQMRFEIASTSNTVAAYLSSITRHLARRESHANTSASASKTKNANEQINEEVLHLVQAFQARKKRVIDAANAQLETISSSNDFSDALLTRARGGTKDSKSETEDSERRKQEKSEASQHLTKVLDLIRDAPKHTLKKPLAKETLILPPIARSLRPCNDAVEGALLEKALPAHVLLRFFLQRTHLSVTVAKRGYGGMPLIYVSDSFVEVTGYSRDECLGRDCRFLQGSLTDHNMTRTLREKIREELPVSVCLLNYRRDQSPFWNFLFLTPIADPSGKLLHYLGVSCEIPTRDQILYAMLECSPGQTPTEVFEKIEHWIPKKPVEAPSCTPPWCAATLIPSLKWPVASKAAPVLQVADEASEKEEGKLTLKSEAVEEMKEEDLTTIEQLQKVADSLLAPAKKRELSVGGPWPATPYATSVPDLADLQSETYMPLVEQLKLRVQRVMGAVDQFSLRQPLHGQVVNVTSRDSSGVSFYLGSGKGMSGLWHECAQKVEHVWDNDEDPSFTLESFLSQTNRMPKRQPPQPYPPMTAGYPPGATRFPPQDPRRPWSNHAMPPPGRLPPSEGRPLPPTTGGPPTVLPPHPPGGPGLPPMPPRRGGMYPPEPMDSSWHRGFPRGGYPPSYPGPYPPMFPSSPYSDVPPSKLPPPPYPQSVEFQPSPWMDPYYYPYSRYSLPPGGFPPGYPPQAPPMYMGRGQYPFDSSNPAPEGDRDAPANLSSKRERPGEGASSSKRLRPL